MKELHLKRSKSTVSKENEENLQNADEGAASAGCSTSNTGDADWKPTSFDVLDQLKFKYELCVDKKGGMNLFIQDTFMETFYAFYPHFVCIDVVCQIPEIKQFLVLFIGIDANAHCEIIAAGFIKSETAEDIVWICDVFKKRNPSWDKVELILSDQTFNTSCLKTVFPEKKVIMSFFHSMKAFKKDLTSLDNAVTEQDINSALQLFEKMLFRTDFAGYLDLNKQMKRMNTPVSRVFKKWNQKKEFWALGLFTDSKTFLKAFNIYLLSIRRKLKPIIRSQETLENVLRNMHSLIYKLRKEFFQQFTKIFHSPTAPYLQGSLMRSYAMFITPFACELIIEQLKKSEDIKNVQKADRPNFYNSDGMLASTYRCLCNYHILMKLPCRHIFAVRRYLFLPLFTMAIRSSWIYSNYSRIYHNLFSVHVSAQEEETRAFMMSNRFEEYVQICHQIWDGIFLTTDTVSQERLETFQTAIKAWKSGFEIGLVRSEKEDDVLLSDSFEALEDLPTDYFKELYGISINDIMDSENEFINVSFNADDDMDIV